MSYIIYVVVGLVAALAVLAAYVRLAPMDYPLLQSWMYPFPPGEESWANGYQVARNVDDPQAVVAQLDAVIMATPRTTRVLGSVEGGLTSYVVRSRVFGFPDFITVMAGTGSTVDGEFGPMFRIDGRAVYGKSDLGVNRARIQGWLADIEGTPE